MNVVFDEIRENDMIEFVYNDKIRCGRIESVKCSKRGVWYAVINGDGAKSFIADKMSEIKLLSEW
jgi:hypothetical protein